MLICNSACINNEYIYREHAMLSDAFPLIETSTINIFKIMQIVKL